jgi:hypothetical protein
MVSNLEKLSSGLKNGANPQAHEAQKLATKIKSDPQIRQELDRDGQARVTDDAGRIFVVKRKLASASAASGLRTL